MGFLAELSTPANPAIPAIQRGVSAGSSAPNSGSSRNSMGRQSQSQVRNICDAIDVSYDDIAHRIDFRALAEWHDLVLAAHVRALALRIEREAGIVPAAYTAPAHCEGCGPVWLWPGAVRVPACPWCLNRRARRPIPRPGHLN